MLSPTIARWWPALPSSWYGSNIAALAAVIAYCWLLALTLLATFVWANWLPGTLVRILWWALSISWLVGVAYNHLIWKPAPTRGPLEQFKSAQQQYLRGEWLEAEVTLKAMLRENPLDAEALLLLAATKRRAGRRRSSGQVLEQLELLDAGSFWQFEVSAERKLLSQPQESSRETDEQIILDDASKSDGEAASIGESDPKNLQNP